MTIKFFEETINGSTLTQIHNAAFDKLVRSYNPGGSVYVSREDMDAMAWEAAMNVYEKKDTYVKEGMNVCGLACTMAYNDLMDYLKKGMRRNMETVPMEVINTEKGVYNTADTETGRKFTTTGVGVGREFDITFREGMEIIESELDKLSFVERQIYEMMLDKVPQKVIAATLNITHTNVRKKWHDIRKKLLKNKYIFGKLREMGLAS